MTHETEKQRPIPPFPPQHLHPPGLEKEMDPAPQYTGPDYPAAGKLRERVALITGGDSGIGRSVAYFFAREGADVAIVYLAEEVQDAEETARQVEALGRSCLLLEGDVCEAAFRQEAVTRTIERFNRLDILVNNAAFQQHVPFDELSEEQWEHTFQTNIHAYFGMVKAALPHLKPGASIINSGSITGLVGSAHLVDYASTKGAIHAFTKSLAGALFDRGIRVNCVAPGPVWTPLNPAERSDEEIREFGAQTPAGRPAQPEEIAPAFLFFASNADSGYISGEVLALLGGGTKAG
jgi:NAD(P)-dependent dehydrogenase (short-subunit alcohol dehydrogenase family)